MYYAVEGCCHGSLDLIYSSIKRIEIRKDIKVELLIICGDFQAVRNIDDLNSMAVPHKHKHMGDFVDYYSGRKTAPMLTLFVGGNHEASNHLWELFHGGWVAPNMYFLGYSGCVLFAGMRIAGISGIYKKDDFSLPMDPKQAYNSTMLRSAYHTRSVQVDQLLSYKMERIDLFVSHDWPTGITSYGDREGLLKQKPYFKDDIESGRLGNPYLMEILKKLKPKIWLSAHLHCKFSAYVQHEDASVTKFLALGKPHRAGDFIQILKANSVSPDTPRDLMYDPSWVDIIAERWSLREYEQYRIKNCVSDYSSWKIPLNFSRDVPTGKVSAGSSYRGLSYLNSRQGEVFQQFVSSKINSIGSGKRTCSDTRDGRRNIVESKLEARDLTDNCDLFEVISCACEGNCTCKSL